MHENQQSHIEGIFARGDRRVADVLEAAFRAGCRFDSWDDALRVDLWEEAIRGSGVEVGRYLGTIPVSARLPWDHLDIGLEPDFLVKEYRKALKDRLSPPCGKPFKRLLHPNNVSDAEAAATAKLVCYDCGVACDLDGMKRERLYYLRRMNAWAPGPAPAATARPTGEPTRIERTPTRPPPRPTQGTPRRYRLRYTKLGRVAYLGHLDLVRHLPRIFRRAGLELYYSVGFHPKPELSFGPALGLGIPSLGELVDVTLVDELEPAELLARLGRVTLEGVGFLEAVRLRDGDRALGRVIAEAQFAARLPPEADAGAALARAAGDAPLVVKRESDKGLARTVDVRRTLRGIDALDEAGVRRRLDWLHGDLLAFRVGVSHEGSARPIEVITALCGEAIAAASDFARLGLRGEAGLDPMCPDDFRAAPALAAPAAATTPAP
jgi:radical SAM-linked protein